MLVICETNSGIVFFQCENWGGRWGRGFVGFVQNFRFVHLYSNELCSNHLLLSSIFWVQKGKNDNRDLVTMHNLRQRNVGA
jgi:hypothetical protein